MHYDEIISTLQNLIGIKPKQREIADIIGVRTSVVGQRASRKSNFSVEDIKKIGQYYKVDLFQKKLQDIPEDVCASDIADILIKKPILTPSYNLGVQFDFEQWGKRLLMLQVQSGMLDSRDFSKYVDIPEKRLNDYILKSKYPKGEDLLKLKIRFSKTDFNWLLFGE